MPALFDTQQVWIFGDIWCRIWLAVDVWMCTASILNLCAISLDRYVAVTRPVTYPSIMSTTKAKSLIAGIWVLSFVICFPPLVGWKDKLVSGCHSSSPLLIISYFQKLFRDFFTILKSNFPYFITASRATGAEYNLYNGKSDLLLGDNTTAGLLYTSFRPIHVSMDLRVDK